ERDLARTERALAAALRPIDFASLLAQREVERAHASATGGRSTGELLAASQQLLVTLGEVIERLAPTFAAAQARLAAAPVARLAAVPTAPEGGRHEWA
ncbi:MAG: hypothetical protein KIT31_17325, partial [Deltaproteobacteria bacterium]|nr:hypothetical protein [Deltaproteobacteria bacterium]